MCACSSNTENFSLFKHRLDSFKRYGRQDEKIKFLSRKGFHYKGTSFATCHFCGNCVNLTTFQVTDAQTLHSEDCIYLQVEESNSRQGDNEIERERKSKRENSEENEKKIVTNIRSEGEKDNLSVTVKAEVRSVLTEEDNGTSQPIYLEHTLKPEGTYKHSVGMTCNIKPGTHLKIIHVATAAPVLTLTTELSTQSATEPTVTHEVTLCPKTTHRRSDDSDTRRLIQGRGTGYKDQDAPANINIISEGNQPTSIYEVRSAEEPPEVVRHQPEVGDGVQLETGNLCSLPPSQHSLTVLRDRAGGSLLDEETGEVYLSGNTAASHQTEDMETGTITLVPIALPVSHRQAHQADDSIEAVPPQDLYGTAQLGI